MSLGKITRILIGLLVVLNFEHTFAQSGTVKQAEKKTIQGNWSGAREVLRKALRKDTLNPEVEIALANLFLNELNPGQQVDSAYRYSLRALSHFSQLNAKQKEKLKRDLIDSAVMVSLRGKIEKTAFTFAKHANSEKSYNDYLDRYKFSIHRDTATELRDEAAYLDALKQNSYKAFDDYIKKYPNSHRAAEAKNRYEKLLFDSRTHDRKWKSYEAFVAAFPQSPYRKEAERKVFEVLTCNGLPAELIRYVDEHPKSAYADFARNILFHIARELDEPVPKRFITDSLQNVVGLDKLVWVPVYKNGKYGFIDSEGTQSLQAQFDNIEENYKCGLVDEDILMTSSGLVSRSGKILSTAKSFKNLGYGFLEIADSCKSVLHKSGMQIYSCFEEASVLEGRYLLIKKNGKVGLLALNGRPLLKPEFISIEMIGQVVILNRMGKKVLVTSRHLSAAADGNELDESFVVDEVRDFGKDRLLVRNGSLEGVIDSKLEFVVPLALQRLTQTQFGLLRKLNDQYIFPDIPELKNERWNSYLIHRQWLLLQSASEKKLYDQLSKKIVESNVDSIWFENGLAFTAHGDSVRVHVSAARKVDVPAGATLFFIKSPDSIRYFFVQQKNKKTVFSIETAAKLFIAEFDNIESLSADYFVVTKKNKKGVLNTKGQVVLPAAYDILMLKENFISLYDGKKFGLYNIANAKIIKPAFERNLIPVDTVVIAFQNGRCGLIDVNGEELGAFEFDEIQPWANGVMWAKKDFDWNLIDFKTSKKILTRVKNIQLIKNTPDEKLAIVKQDNLFGVVSNVHGVVIPPSFTFLLNLGSEDEPLYFTAKDVEEAGIVVVIYYDKTGKLLRKQVYEDEEYARIVCPQD
ncbi:MAG TPA: WG repeat-containing protein [Cyclobacteriaceae bacterium]|nr:WG repeat-containing protein [Cyclobacteriaceae bacterium]